MGANLTKVRAIQMQVDVLSDWIAELGQNFDKDLSRVYEGG